MECVLLLVEYVFIVLPLLFLFSLIYFYVFECEAHGVKVVTGHFYPR